MGENSKIEWTDATWNPWQGCTKVSPACQHCYMFRDLQRFGRDPSIVVRSKQSTFELPLKKKRNGEFAIPAGSKVFTCSWSDWFHEAADSWRDEAWGIVRRRPDVIFQIVTKRIERIARCLPSDWGNGYPNVWLIATAENQEWLERRASELVTIPAKVRGLSIEPLLEQIDLSLYLGHVHEDSIGVTRPHSDSVIHDPWIHGINWVIVGGESGPNSRPMHPDWVRSIRDQCQAAGVPFFFKQWGEWCHSADVFDAGPNASTRCGLPRTMPIIHYDGVDMVRCGRKAAGRLLDGREWNEFPQVRCV